MLSVVVFCIIPTAVVIMLLLLVLFVVQLLLLAARQIAPKGDNDTLNLDTRLNLLITLRHSFSI